MRRLIFVSASAVLMSSATVYGDATWVGDSSQNWNTAANWTSDPSNPTGNFFITTSIGNSPVLGATSAFVPVDVIIGDAGNAGRLDHTGVTLSLANISENGNWFFVGRAGNTGTYNIANTAVSGGGITGFGTGTGNLNVGKLWVGGSRFFEGGNGVVNLNTSGVINANSTQDFGNSRASVSLGYGAGSSGVINLENGTLNANSELWVGFTGAGTINQSGGTVNSTEFFVVGRGGTGVYNMTGGTVNAATGLGFAVLGSFGGSNGTLNVSGGTFNVAGGRQLLVGEGGNGTLNISGTGYVSTTNLSEGVRLAANGGSGVVNLDGGTLSTPTVSKGATGSAIFNFNGGVLRASAGNANFMIGLDQANVLNNGAIIDTNGHDITVGQALMQGSGSSGGLTKNSAGTLTLAGATSTYTGATTVNSGRLNLSNATLSATSAVNVATGASLGARGSSHVGGSVSLSSGTLDLTGDNAAGTLSIGGALSLTGGAVNFEFAGGTADRINTAGAVTRSGTQTLNLSLASGALSAGSYTLMTGASGLGASGFTIGNKPAGFFNFSLASSTSTAAILTVTGNPTPAIAYWTGVASQDGISPDASNNWGYGSSLAPSKSNWSTTANGLTDPVQVPGPSTDVIFAATNAVGNAGVLNTRLDASYSVQSLRFDVPASTGITQSGIATNAQTLTLGSGGLVLAATSNASGSITGSGSVVLNGSQTWANQNTRSLSVNSPVNALSGATTLTIGGSGTGNIDLGSGVNNGGGTLSVVVNRSSGTTTIGGTSTYTGNTTINAGTVAITGTVNAAAVNIGGEGGTGVMHVGPGANVTYNGLSNVGYRTGSGTLNITGGNFSNGNEDFRVGGSDLNGATYNASGVVNISGATVTFGALTVARGNFSDNTASGTVNITSGNVTAINDVILGFAGNNNLGKLSVSGGTFNVGPAALKWFMLGFFDSSHGQLDVSGGSVNLMNSSSIKMNRSNTIGANVINQTGGEITFYSDAGTTVGGAGNIDMEFAGLAASSNTYNLDGGTLTVPSIIASNQNGTRVFNFNGGTLKAAGNTASLLSLGAGSATVNVRNGGAKIDSNGFAATIASQLVHSTIGGDAAIDGGLTKTGAGTLILAGNATYNGPTNVNAGTLAINKANSGGGAITVAAGAAIAFNSTSASGSLSASSMTLNGSTLAFNLGATGYGTDPLYNLSGNLNRSGTNLINVSGSLSSGTVTLIQYAGGETGGGSFTLGTLPNRTTGTLYDLGAGRVDLAIIVNALKWSGLGDGTWAAAAQTPKNWVDGINPADYSEGDPVLFDDTATGLTTVNIPTTVSPTSVTVNTSTLSYSFTGAGGITGTGALLKNGSTTLTVSNTSDNTYSGGTVINAGTLELAGTGTSAGPMLGTGSIVNNAAIVQNRASILFIPNNITGAGSLISNGLTVLSGNNTFDGLVTVNSNRLFLDSQTALGNTVGGTVIKTGGSIGIFLGNFNFGAETFTIEGDGGGDGAMRIGGNRAVTMGGTISLTGNTEIVVDGGSSLLWTGAVQGGSFDLALDGTGRLIIAGNATYGQSLVNQSFLQIGDGGTLGNLGSGDVNLTNATLEFNRSDTYSVNNRITNIGAVTQSGTGTTILTSAASDFFGQVVVNNGTLELAGIGYPSTMTVNGNGVMKMTNDLYGLLVPAVLVNSNNAQTGGIELSGGVTAPFSGGTITIAGRNNLSSSIRSANGTNALSGNIVLAAGGNQYRFEAANGGTFNLSAAASVGTGLGGDRNVTFAGAGVGTMTGVISTGGAGTLGLLKVGAGTWTMDAAHSYNGPTTVNGGTLVLKQVAQNPVLSGNGANIQNGYLVMEHGADGGVFAGTVETQLTAGFNQSLAKFATGTYRSSTADASKGLGWKDDGSSTMIGYAYYGDANVDGSVDSTDFNVFTSNYGKASNVNWAGGDFDYNDKVNTLDFNYLAGNFGLTITAPIAGPELGSPVASLGTVVPEPASLSLLAMGGGMMLRRRNRR